MATKPEKAKRADNAEANRIKRLQRTKKKQPNNKQIDAALKTTRIHRKTPQNPIWSASWRKIAQLIKEVTGHFDPKIMSSNQTLAQEALAKVASKPGTYTKSMPSRPFSLAERTKDKYGNYVWAL